MAWTYVTCGEGVSKQRRWKREERSRGVGMTRGHLEREEGSKKRVSGAQYAGAEESGKNSCGAASEGAGKTGEGRKWATDVHGRERSAFISYIDLGLNTRRKRPCLHQQHYLSCSLMHSPL